MDAFLVAFVTASSLEEAEGIARALVDGGAAPCVNILPGAVSIYRWRGETVREAEILMIVKTRRDLFPRVREIVEARHSYEVPEIVAAPLAELSPAYRDYLEGYFRENA